jgi:ABC-type transport system involved in cytochrome c biogenesis permease subunit
MKGFLSWFPWVAVAFTGLWLAAFAWPRSDPRDGLHLREFGCLPVVQGGRVMPLDTVARLNLTGIRYGQDLIVGDIDPNNGVEKNKKTYPATKWLLETMSSMGKGPSFEYRIFRIESDQVRNLLNLKYREGWRYSMNEIFPHMEELFKEADRADKIPSKYHSLFDTKVMELARNVSHFMKFTRLEAPLMVQLEGEPDNWVPLGRHLQEVQQRQANLLPAAEAYLQMLVAFQKSVHPSSEEQEVKEAVATFNKEVANYSKVLEQEQPEVLRRTRLEVWFNEFTPFYHCSILYALAAILGCASWLGCFKPLNRAAFYSTLLIFVVHTCALVARMYIQGRPPVTNLYSALVFIGWGCVTTSLIVEALFRNSLAVVVGAITGALSLVVAHYLSLDGDTLGMLQAVLDTNFWLATHVVCISLGNTTCFVSGFMGIAYIVLGIFTPLLARGNAAALSKMLYGVICFGMFLTFTGTVLGGIWGDQSWGRFWGWDPKENGALLLVLWNALILHARWGGMVKQRGVAQLAVLGNAVAAWSLFGTNLLGVGLHTYGFMEGAMQWLIAWVLLQILICSLGFLPMRQWSSFQPQTRPDGSHSRKAQLQVS